MADETGFARRAADTLKALDKALSEVDDRVEVDLAGDVLTLEFPDRRQFIINSHSAARQIWLSAEARAWHFSHDEVSGRWIDTREGHELWALVGSLVAKKLGREISLKR